MKIIQALNKGRFIMARKIFSLLGAVLILVVSITMPGFAQDNRPDVSVPDEALAETFGIKTGTNTYIVQLVDEPVVTYDGGIQDLPATKLTKGKKINPHSASIRGYTNHLRDQQAAVLNATGAVEQFYNYVYSFNGYSAALTRQQAIATAKHPNVQMIFPEEILQIETDNTPEFLGLTERGLWDQLGGRGNAGEDIIIGVIDTGIWPEHPSFSDQLDLSDASGRSGKRNSAYGPPPSDWFGECVSGEQFSQEDCNNKLIGARFYRVGAEAATVITEDYLSPRDRDGHGTHTASTAGGNANVPAEIFGIDRGMVSGIAPRARIAAYKVCWNNVGCFVSDIIKAIDDAVADGVDVINYSIGGGASLLGPDDIAYLFAAEAGVFVATSAGNSGPGPDTVSGPASVPWITAVGASTQDRTFEGSVKLENGAEYFGASLTGGTDVLPLVDAEDAGSELCHPDALDPALVADKIVLCLRGEIARVDKSRAVFEAGAAGMVLYNTSDTEAQITDNHFVPTVHINNTDGLAAKAYIDSAGPTATAQITGGEKVTIPAPWMAAFSSRGPNGIAPDIIKPDVTAPGVNILAGNTPNPYFGAPGELFLAISGTSMSSPHVAGVGALLKQAHPDWTPAMIKSALMTTGSQDVKKEDGATPADPFDMGSGHIAPNSAVDPGWLYQAGFRDYQAFLCGATTGVSQNTCDVLERFGFSFDASDLNLASIGIAELAGVQTVPRTVTSVTPGAATYNVSVDAPPGISVAVNPSSLTLAEGESGTYEVTFTTTSSATLDEWAFGSLAWSDSVHNVRSPIAIKPVVLAAPDEVSGTGTDGTLSYEITFGYSGDFAANPHGLIPAETQADTVVDDPANDINTALSTGVGITVHVVDIPAGTKYARFSLFDGDTDGQDDLDLYVFDPDTADFVGSSGTPTSAEEVNLENPDPGMYQVVVHGWQTDGPDANYTLFSWALGAADAGNMTVTAPSSAILGASDTVTVDWSSLETATKYLGSVTYHDITSPSGYNDGLIDFTLVRIDTDWH
ncbi:S8 family serine peptidase [Nitrosococcus wardiae]|uniref:Serine protease n=1 Tax=Nitrosococcus wardiae TaxID=1814290 RepID=A0A4P7C272_9GAMM|nr:S8 family serine peptidase [Nitrosococcus wardiae]QBQ54982.1 hypothetical protein E3U44_10995 [Nitrosococcus wardiae]